MTTPFPLSLPLLQSPSHAASGFAAELRVPQVVVLLGPVFITLAREHVFDAAFAHHGPHVDVHEPQFINIC